MSASRDRGTKAETAVVNYLQAHGYLHAERRALPRNAGVGLGVLMRRRRGGDWSALMSVEGLLVLLGHGGEDAE